LNVIGADEVLDQYQDVPNEEAAGHNTTIGLFPGPKSHKKERFNLCKYTLCVNLHGSHCTSHFDQDRLGLVLIIGYSNIQFVEPVS
jgi:hypothetical protein